MPITITLPHFPTSPLPHFLLSPPAAGGKVRKTREDAALTRQLILDTAVKVFSRKGYTRTTLEVVAGEAGVTRGAIYWHFANKFEMFRAVLKGLYEKAVQRITAILESQQCPLEKLRQLLREFFLMISDEEEFRLIEEVEIFKFEKKRELKELFSDHLENVKVMRDLVKKLLAAGIASGEFKSGLDPDLAAMALISYFAGMKSAWLSSLTDISLVENAEKLIDIFINGIAND